ncbi:MAG TPA: methionyl-tRNA formyltransferase [Acidimicrobiales bacterium]|jgi:methionyl-tRNA formyltransferase|nr:methionyl-tRNA formyltransferase [Acidimicrobiales bacterium]
MRLAFCGSPSFAVPVLDALIDAGHDVACVVSRPDRRRGRGARTTPTPVKEAALARGIAVTERVEDLASMALDLGVVVAFGAMVPTTVLEHLAMCNLHFSLLPRWRGAAPVERAILAGDEVTGVCVMRLEPALDTGSVYARTATDVDDKDLESLRTELVARGTDLLVELLRAGHDGLPEPVPQEGEPTYAKKVTDDELELDFQRPARELARVVRLGRARTSAAGTRLIVRRCEVLDGVPGEPGELLEDVVSCGEGALRLVEIVPEGRRAMTPAEWRRGLRGPVPAHLGTTDGP